MSAPCDIGYSVGTLVKYEYYSGRNSVGIIVGIEHFPHMYTVYIDDKFERWVAQFLRSRIVSAASPQVKCL